MKIFLSLLALALSISASYSQKTWSFQDCVDYAVANNIQVNQAKLSQELAKNTVLQNKMSMYTPNVNVTISESFNFANSINPLTYQFVQQNTNSTSMGINFDYSLFEGLQRMNQLRSSKLELDASNYEQQELENNTKLLLANYYLNVLVSYEALQIANQQKLLTANQYQNTLELVNAGLLADGDRYEVEAQMANNDVAVVTSENNLELALNQLKLLLQLDPNESFSIENIVISEEELSEDIKSVSFVSGNAEAVLPNLKSAELRKQAAEFQLKAAKGSLSPTLSFSAYVGTNYFSASQEQVGTSAATAIPIGYVGGSNQVVLTNFEQPIFGDKSFGQQFGDNLNQNIRFNLFIPIFGKWQRMTAIDNAKINILNSEFDYQLKKNNLQQDVFTAYTNLKAAKKQLSANDKNKEAANLAFFYAEEKFKAGIINAYEFEIVKNRYITAEANAIQSKYDYIFKKLIVNFYETGNLSF